MSVQPGGFKLLHAVARNIVTGEEIDKGLVAKGKDFEVFNCALMFLYNEQHKEAELYMQKMNEGGAWFALSKVF
jgi:hypothetical protein